MPILQEIGRGFLHLLFPAVCNTCGRLLTQAERDFCDSCRSELTHDPFETCPRCASNVGPFALTENGCTQCRDDSLHFEKVTRLGIYDGLLREAILRLKYSSGEALAEHLGKLWAAHSKDKLQSFAADLVIPVPLHWWRRWRRGYNQSEAIARRLARSLGLRCRPGWLRRIRATPPQTSQTRTGRRENMRGAFAAKKRLGLAGKTVLLVDDVLTTGSTCSDAARALKAAGASKVVVAVLAHSKH